MKIPFCALALLLTVFLPPLVAGQSRALATEGITCRPAPCVLPVTLASEGTSADIYSPIAVNPTNPEQLIVGSDDGNCGTSNQLGFHVTSNGGATWNTACMPALHVFGQKYDPFDFPVVGYDLKGTAYIAGYYQVPGPFGPSVIAVQKSADGVNWNAPTVAVGTSSSDFISAALAVDQTASSPYANSVYVAGMNFGSEVLVSHSRDGGETWTQELVVMDPPHVSTLEYDVSITVGKDGTVYLAWMHCPFSTGKDAYCPNSVENVAFSRSSDGGLTWSKPKIVAKVREVPNACGCFGFGQIPNTTVSAPNTPALGIDNSNGPYSGRLYATMFDWTGTYMRVWVIHSSDGGNTWSKPVPVAPPSETHDQFFPWLSVSPNGRVGVSWFDRRNDPANVSYQAYAAISSDGGESFQPDVQLTSAFSNPDNNSYDGILGHYAGNTWDGPNYFIAAWMDTSNGVSSQDYIGGIRVH